MKLKNLLLVVLISAATAVLSVWGYSKYMETQYSGVQEINGKLPVNYAGFFGNNTPVSTVDFTAAASSATPAVVHIKTRTKARQVTNNLPQQRNPFSDFFGDDDPFGGFFSGPRVQTIPEQRASGSGALISDDGYIVTNNHVVEGADEVNVTLANKKSYKATVIGTDPSTDLAVIKIDGKALPYLVYGNSDDVKLGQWVLAIGYPLTLDVTVTAGIVSAKARSIGINKSKSAVESFIQTDAAVNPGNSGGPLVNTAGELVGINSAIASPTGSYAGYSYAIPVNIVRKTVNDLIKYGAVQRGYLGISYVPDNLTDMQKKSMGVPEGNGIYVSGVAEDGAAIQGGIKKGDFITKINGVAIGSSAELQEQLSRYKPGDKLSVTYTRGGTENTTSVTLKNKAGTYAQVQAASVLDKLGGDLATVDASTAKRNGIDGGVQIKKLGNGALKNSRIQEGFIITSINGQPVKTLDDLKSILANATGNVKLEGIYPGYEETYGYPLNLSDDNGYGDDNGGNDNGDDGQ
ncbi:PDZ domain-containing protein [Ilyomonas limi]|uniref:PDZ domain-containing protein n=1 Tax=Ilyomonas limi TaxID=2575867 RepID=A0A4V5UUF1_9BACT|nr:trypsin-like peptidase domain-containing protein [Ilyomonas limi]TKK68833.1 PDZ domain-containing protein [Ilyomonas limi]